MSVTCYKHCADCGEEMDIVKDTVYCEGCVTSCEEEINELTERIADLERELYEALKEIEGQENKSE
jgi:hypothetical protein